MPKLILSVDDKVLDEYTIDKDTITIGRRTDNDICLDNLAISGYHSQITTVLNDSFLEDLNSTNGTFVNSKIVKKHALKDGDIIDIGNHRIKYINHLATSSANSEFEKTVVMTPNSSEKNLDDSIKSVVDEIYALANAERQSSDNSSEVIKDVNENIMDDVNNINENISTVNNKEAADPIEEVNEDKEQHPEESTQQHDSPTQLISSANKLGLIQILSGSNSGKELVLDKSLTTIGKPNVAVVGITKRSSGYFIIHIDGSEDTASKLNGEVIEGKAQPLEDHDIIDVAGIKLEFFVE